MDRTRPPLHLRNSPLVYVLGQVRFSAVESIGKYVPEIQDQLRKKGYPRFSESEIQDIRIKPSAPPELSSAPRFEFQDKSRQAGIVVTRDFLSFHVSHYESFEKFSSELAAALEVVHGVVGLGIIERLGLRYVDLIRPVANESIADYVHPGLLGLDPAQFQARDSRLMVRMLSRTAHGILNIRFAQRDDGIALPPDLQPSTLDHGALSVAEGEVLSLLDFDHFMQYEKGGPDFDVNEVLSSFWNLHDTTDLAFRTTVTPRAMTVWGANELP